MDLLPISSVMRTIKTVYENLITNLPDIEFDMDELKELYHLRWSLETAYRDLKYPLCLNSFHSKKYTYIVQEVFARAIMYNFCAEILKFDAWYVIIIIVYLCGLEPCRKTNIT